MGLTGKKDYKELYGRGSAQVVSMLTFNFAGPSLNTAKVQKKLFRASFIFLFIISYLIATRVFKIELQLWLYGGIN